MNKCFNISPKFIQIHFLTSFPPSLLNRDDIGFAKRVPFGNSTRLRISSQCLKRHWRTHEGVHSIKNLPFQTSIRSRKILSDLIFMPLQEEFGIELALEATIWLKDSILGKSENSQKKEKQENKKNKNEELVTLEKAKLSIELEQIIALGRPEIEYLLKVGRDFCKEKKNSNDKFLESLKKDLKENLAALGKGAMGLDVALFGRMVTSDFLARYDAAVHVAHAFTVHNERVETDYFTAVDDIKTQGSAHINNSELTTGLYYGYVVVDVPLLVSNLVGSKREEWVIEDRSLAAQVVQSLMHLIAKVTPGAKLGSTAPYAYSHLFLVEMGDSQPCSLANAFLEALKADDKIATNACQQLCNFISRMDDVYGAENTRCLVSLIQGEFLEKISNCRIAPTFKELTEWTVQKIQGA